MVKFIYVILTVLITSLIIRFNYNPFIFEAEAAYGIDVVKWIYLPSFATLQFITFTALIVAGVVYMIEVAKI
jgi:hypothetical protein